MLKRQWHRKFFVLMAGIVLSFAVITMVVSAAAKDDFKDLTEKTRHYKHIDSLYSQKIINGFPDQTFRPGENMKRVDVAVMIYNALHLEPGNVDSLTFTDVPDRAKEAVAALKEKGILDGYNEKIFGAQDTVTRGQVAKFIALAFELDLAVNDQGYTDIDESRSLEEYVNALGASGIAQGYPSGAFGIHDDVKRGDFAAFLDRAMNFDERPKVISIE
ncbi:S-layer homology domain-containing protein [Bacillaceae bacterium W0354]